MWIVFILISDFSWNDLTIEPLWIVQLWAEDKILTHSGKYASIHAESEMFDSILYSQKNALVNKSFFY